MSSPSGSVASVGDVLQAASERLRESGSETARLDAEVLLAHVLRVERTGVLAHPEARLGPAQVAAFREVVDRRATGEPVAYVRGMKEFYGLVFAVDRRALIPRPETERLVELAVARVRAVLTSAPRPPGSPPFRAWDVGTGTGAVAIAMAVALRRRGYGEAVRLIATDASRDAVGLAVENAVAHGVADIVDFAVGVLLGVEPVPATPVDLIVANLPYIPTADLPGLPVAARFEPVAALDGGPDGLSVLRALLPQLPGALRPDGQALLEIGSNQAEALTAAAAVALPGWTVVVHADLSGQPRVVQLDPGRAAATRDAQLDPGRAAATRDAQLDPGRAAATPNA